MATKYKSDKGYYTYEVINDSGTPNDTSDDVKNIRTYNKSTGAVINVNSDTGEVKDSFYQTGSGRSYTYVDPLPQSSVDAYNTKVDEYNLALPSNQTPVNKMSYSGTEIKTQSSTPIVNNYKPVNSLPSGLFVDSAVSGSLVKSTPERYGVDGRYEYPITGDAYNNFRGFKERAKNVGYVFQDIGQKIIPFGNKGDNINVLGVNNPTAKFILETPVNYPKTALVTGYFAPSLTAGVLGVTAGSQIVGKGINNYQIRNIDKSVYDQNDYVFDRQLLLSNVDDTKFSFSKPFSTGTKNILEGVSYGFYDKKNLQKGFGVVYQNYLDKGYSSNMAEIKTSYAIKRFKADVTSEFMGEIVVGVGSNFIGGKIINSAESFYPKVSKFVSPKIGYYSSRVVGMFPAGAYEGNMFVGERKGYVTKTEMTKTDVIYSSLIGGASATGAQIFIETGVSGLLGQAKGFPIKTTRGMSVREKVLYASDPLEPVSDSLSMFGSKGLSKARTFTFSIPESFSPSSKSFVNSNPRNKVTKSMPYNSFNEVFVNPKPKPNSNPFVNPKPSSNPFVNPKPDVNPYPNPKSNPFVNPNPLTNTNPFTNVNPNPFTNTNTNVFVGKIPFVPPMRGFGGESFGFGKRSRRKSFYVPSLSALGLNIKAKKQRNELTGIGIRPIIG